MSYGVGLHFKRVNSSQEFLELINKIQEVEKDFKNIKEMIDLEGPYLVEKYRKCVQLKLVKNGIPISYIFGDVLQGIFSHRFYYWPEYKLVALLYMPSKLPSYLKDLFDGYIYFQNSCDQDYEYNEWSCLGDWVSPIITDVKAKSKAEIYKLLYNEEPDEEEIASWADSEYYKKSLVYKYIEEALDIDNVLWLNKTNKFQHLMVTIPFKDDNYRIANEAIRLLAERAKEENW